MIYYKYTNGEAFTYNGVPYIGFFHVNDSSEAYSEKTTSSTSYKLSPTETYIADFYLNKMEFDNTLNNIDNISYDSTNYFDILNKNELDKIFNVLNSNNLKVFKSFITKNPEIINFEKYNSYYYGLSSTPVDTKNNDELIAKTGYGQIDPFSYSEDWKFLDEVRTGTLLLYDNEYKYVLSTGRDLIVLSGNLNSIAPPEITRNDKLPIPEEIHQIYHDPQNDRLSIVYNEEIVVYSASNFMNCDVLLTIDRISLKKVSTTFIKWSTREKFNRLRSTFGNRYLNDNPNNPESLRFGKNVRINIANGVITIINKYSNDIINTISLKSIDVESVLKVDIRVVDDLIAILHKNDNSYYISFLNPETLEVNQYPIEGITDGSGLKFSETDSNTFYTSNTSNLQTRFITNPQYPVGKTNNNNLKYLRKNTFGNLGEAFGKTKLKWNSNSLKSNNFNNIIFGEAHNLTNQVIILHNIGRLYLLRHPISQEMVTSIPLSIKKSYNGTTCTATSLGLDFNMKILKIVEDLLTLHNQARSSFSFGDDLREDIIDDLTYEIDNFFIQNNESFNTITIQRILILINDLQNTLINPTST